MYLSDVPTVALDPGVERVLNTGVPGVQQASYTPSTITVKLPSFNRSTLSPLEIAAIGGAVLLFLLSGRKR